MKLTEDTLLYAIMCFDPDTKDLVYSTGVNRTFKTWIGSLTEEDEVRVRRMLDEDFNLVKEYPDENGDGGSLNHYSCEKDGWVMNFIEIKI